MSAIKWIFLPYRKKVEPLAKTLLNARASVIKKLLCVILLVISLPLLCLFFITWSYKFISKLPKGTGYLIAAIVLTALLFPFGSEVGGMKVNLNLGIPIQPSELAKYLMVIFMAAYFCENATTIIKYSNESHVTGKLFVRKLKMMLGFLVGIFLLMGLYLVLSDMGPALIILVTFILFYSMIKSTVAVKANAEATEKLRQIFTCDLAMLIYGVVSFMAFIAIGKYIENTILMGLLWFPVWIIFFLTKKRIYESAILFNAILALFMFGGDILNAVGLEEDAARFEQRMEMSQNIWGVIGDGAANQDPTSNSQVANGLWAIASGGFSGQGVGNGASQTVPAFNTDMVLMSFGENMGFVGICAVLISFGLLLWQTLKVGFLARHKFAMFLCMGIAIVTGVQLMVIIMGTLGLISLTGVTVAFMSFGNASIIMNFLALGLVLSISAHTSAEHSYNKSHTEASKAIDGYDYPMVVLSCAVGVLFLIVLSSFFKNMVLNRDEIMIKPVFAEARNGMPQIEYNPRISILTDKMKMGNIYDRNGLVLATHDKSMVRDFGIYDELQISPDTLRRLKRYYPFGEHTFFMIGDFNSKFLFSYNEDNPIGYMAEAQHLSYLRGYDNVLRRNGEPVKVDIYGDKVKTVRFTPVVADTLTGVILRDYSALLPYLKSGVNSNRIKRFNDRTETIFDEDKITPHDLQLTIDAELQVKVQKAIADYCINTFNGNNLIRASAVILDAQNGDLLTSANYPLPDYELLTTEYENRQLTQRYSYSDNKKPWSWNAYTDVDLGLTYQTPPGSTAKVMSAMAGFASENGDKVDNQTYMVYFDEIIEKGKVNEPIGNVTLNEALKISSNLYFINLVNDYELYDELSNIYRYAGLRLADSESLDGQPAYTLNYRKYNREDSLKWSRFISTRASVGVRNYREYIKNRREKGIMYQMNREESYMWRWAWGQGGEHGNLMASPLNMARIISAAVNNGRMAHTQYVLNDSLRMLNTGSEQLIPARYVDNLNKHLHDQAAYNGRFMAGDIRFGGKTGTPERGRILMNNRISKPNDAWYIFYIKNARVVSCDSVNSRKEITNNNVDTTTLAVAVRIERTDTNGSTRAMKLSEKIVEVLQQQNYID